MSAALYESVVMHARLVPKRHLFRYRVFSLLLDVDQLGELDRVSPIFSVDRFNLFSFCSRDHGAADGSSLRAWAEAQLAAFGIALHGGRIELLCFPRVLGYAFNPLSLWYCRDREDRLRAIIYEVRNTFGERHSYIVHAQGEEPLQAGQWYGARKDFHVSPFLPLDLDYRFRIGLPGPSLDVFIDVRDSNGERCLVARQSGRRREFTTRQLLRIFLAIPLMTLKVTAMIHWQALRMLVRGFDFFGKPPAQAGKASAAWPLNVH